MPGAYSRAVGLSARQRLISGIDTDRFEQTQLDVRRIAGTIRAVNHLDKPVVNLGAS